MPGSVTFRRTSRQGGRASAGNRRNPACNWPGSYGLAGNSEIPSYFSLALLRSNYTTVLNDTRVGGTGLNRLGNRNLRWETAAQSDVGLELGLFNNRISVEADLYYRKTTGMLPDAPVPRTSGYPSIRKNIGSMENKELELSLNATPVQAGKFTWNANFNIAMNRNKILALASPADTTSSGTST